MDASHNPSADTLDWPVSQPPALSQAHLRSSPEDFRVDEIPPCLPGGEGEHIWLHIRKRGLNTADVARMLSSASGLHPRNISFAGMKDRHAVTTQWFSVHLPGKGDIDFTSLWNDDLQCLEKKRHDRKLKRGGLKGNRFTLVLRACMGDRAAADERLRDIVTQGVPDYFGEQRFGREGSNLRMFDQLLSGRMPRGKEKRGILLSSVRSWLFNQVLAERVRDASWNQILSGEAVMLAGSRSVFVADADDEALHQRVQQADIHPSGPLPGDAGFSPALAALDLENRVLEPYLELVQALVKQGVNGARRPLRVIPEQLQWQWLDDESLELSFSLPSGAYATAVLRELAVYEDQRGGVLFRQTPT